MRHFTLIFILPFKSSELICISSKSLPPSAFQILSYQMWLEAVNWSTQFCVISPKVTRGTKLHLLVVGTYSWTRPCWLPSLQWEEFLQALPKSMSALGATFLRTRDQMFFRRQCQDESPMRVVGATLELGVPPLIHSPLHSFPLSREWALFCKEQVRYCHHRTAAFWGSSTRFCESDEDFGHVLCSILSSPLTPPPMIHLCLREAAHVVNCPYPMACHSPKLQIKVFVTSLP